MSQTEKAEILTGRIINTQNKALPYASIYVLSTGDGAISNEDGFFSLNTNALKASDSIRFQYLGYAELNVSLAELRIDSLVRMKEKLTRLSELFVYGDPPKAKDVVKKVLENKAKNYPDHHSQMELFVRERYDQHLDKLNIRYRKSSIDILDKKLFEELEQKIPEYTTWYTDFLGTAHESYEDEERKLKLSDKRVVALEQEELNDLEDIEKIFTDLAKNTQKEEYWKLKTGILSQKIELTEDSLAGEDGDEEIQSIKYLRSRIRSQLEFADLSDDDDWEFLHKTGKYDYSLIGGSFYNGEQVFIVDFEPRYSAQFKGRLYISASTYALLRTDFSYAPDQLGMDIQLFGVGYTQNAFEASVIFEKQGDAYCLKYFRKKTGMNFSFDRKLDLLKKRERFLFDKELDRVRSRLDVSVNEVSSIEILVLKRKEISRSAFESTQSDSHMRVIYVDQFRDELWDGYSIIEPTKAMKEYKK